MQATSENDIYTGSGPTMNARTGPLHVQAHVLLLDTLFLMGVKIAYGHDNEAVIAGKCFTRTLYFVNTFHTDCSP